MSACTGTRQLNHTSTRSKLAADLPSWAPQVHCGRSPDADLSPEQKSRPSPPRVLAPATYTGAVREILAVAPEGEPRAHNAPAIQTPRQTSCSSDGTSASAAGRQDLIGRGQKGGAHSSPSLARQMRSFVSADSTGAHSERGHFVSDWRCEKRARHGRTGTLRWSRRRRFWRRSWRRIQLKGCKLCVSCFLLILFRYFDLSSLSFASSDSLYHPFFYQSPSVRLVLFSAHVNPTHSALRVSRF
ncbi:hypothetical protein DFH06DRAFT_694544 [Mycena polygramma]|nr:hypothetical protein DFH06DRAFT_694544 [Mycena polygramma]